MAHPHVERAAEPEREAALGLVELHRGNADVHHDAVHFGHALRRADLREVGESVLDQGQPAIGLVDQIESAGNRRPVAVDADDPGSRDSEDRAAVAAGAEGRVDIDAAVLGGEHLDRLAAKNGDMARRSRAHAPSPGVFQPAEWKMDANGPIAPQISALRRAFPAEKPRTGTIAASGPASRPLISRRNLLGCHGISSAKEGLGRPQPGSALHHLVTALSVKKALMIGCGFCALFYTPKSGDARCTHPKSKCGLEPDRRIARARGKRIVNGILLPQHDIAVLLPGLSSKNDFWFVRICWY